MTSSLWVRDEIVKTGMALGPVSELDRSLAGPYARAEAQKFVYEQISVIAQNIRSRQISAVDVVESHLRRIAQLQPKINAFVHLDEAGSRAAAQRADTAIAGGLRLGPLHGVPLTIKSCIDIAGWRCPAGSLTKSKYFATSDAPLVARLRAAGAVLLGNTNTPEFLMAYETDNALSGRTSNPWNLEFSSGGSSGGEAAAIAAGCSAGGVGSDGGGSIRLPAHFCGICGLKPTPGRIPSTGHFPPGAGALSWLGVVGPMARTVGDLRLLFEVMAGPDDCDALAAPVPVASADHELHGLRIGVLESSDLGAASPETVEAVALAAKYISAAGAKVEPLKLDGLERALNLWWFFFGNVVGHLLDADGLHRDPSISPGLSDYFAAALAGPEITLDKFLWACAERDIIRAELLRQMQNMCVVLSPVCLSPAFRHAAGTWKSGDGYRETMRHSQWLNLAGFPAITLPMTKSHGGLPIAVQIIGRPFEEARILAVAEAIESARGPWQPPPIS